MLEIAVAVLGLFCVVLAVACYQLSLKLRQQAELQKERDAMRDQRLKELSKRLDAYLTGSIRMGEELHELRRVVAPLPDKLTQIEQRPHQPVFHPGRTAGWDGRQRRRPDPVLRTNPGRGRAGQPLAQGAETALLILFGRGVALAPDFLAAGESCVTWFA